MLKINTASNDGHMTVAERLTLLDAHAAGVGQTGQGKALRNGEPVLMAGGSWRAIETLEIGDALASVDGRPSIVTGVFPQGERPLNTVVLDDGRRIDADDDHLWEVFNWWWDQPKVLTTAVLRGLLDRGMRGRLSIRLISGDFGWARPSMDPYLLGVLVGDGSLTKGCEFTTMDADIVERVSQALPERHVVVQRVQNHGSLAHAYGIKCLDWRSNEILAAVRKLALNVKAERKHLPDEVFGWRREDRWALLQGLLDTDGTIDAVASVSFSTSSPQLAIDVRRLVWSLGGKCPVRVKPTTHLPNYILRLRLSGASNPFYCARKAQKWRPTQYAGAQRAILREVVQAPRDHATCITVSHPDRLFVSRDYIVTHNSWLMRGLAEDVFIAKRQLAIIDPTGVHWGIRAGKDGGKDKGLPIAIFGGKRGDSPLYYGAGAQLGSLIGTRTLSAIFDLSQMDSEEQTLFVAEFLRSLYNTNEKPLHLFVDEADEFAPESGSKSEGSARSLEQMARIVKRGRVRGFRMLSLTQRPADISKRILAQSPVLLMKRMTEPVDLGAVEKRLKGGANGKGDEFLKLLPTLPRDRVIVWGPSVGVAQIADVPAIRTFDSMRAPDDSGWLPPETLADVDLSTLQLAAPEPPPTAESNSDQGAAKANKKQGAKPAMLAETGQKELAPSTAELQRAVAAAVKEAVHAERRRHQSELTRATKKALEAGMAVERDKVCMALSEIGVIPTAKVIPIRAEKAGKKGVRKVTKNPTLPEPKKAPKKARARKRRN